MYLQNPLSSNDVSLEISDGGGGIRNPVCQDAVDTSEKVCKYSYKYVYINYIYVSKLAYTRYIQKIYALRKI